MDVKLVCRLCLCRSGKLVWVFDERFDSVRYMKDLIFNTTGVEINKEDEISQKICTECGQDVVRLFKFREQSLKNDKLLKDLQNNAMATKKSPTHESVKKIHHSYPGLKLPNIVLSMDLFPVVEMEIDQVEKYFIKKNINMKKHVQQIKRVERLNNKTPPVSPISIKYRQEKSSYEIVHKSIQHHSNDGDGCLQNEIVDLIDKSMPLANRKRKNSFTDSSPNKKIVSTDTQTIDTERTIEDLFPVKRIEIEQQPLPDLPPISLQATDQNATIEHDTFPIDCPQSIPSSEGVDVAVPFGSASSMETTLQEPFVHIDEQSIRERSISAIESIRIEMVRSEASVCKFCSDVYDSESALQTHLTVCFTKKAAESSPDVVLERIEDDENNRRTYSEALSRLLAIDDVIDINSDEKSCDAASIISPSIVITDSQFPGTNYDVDTVNLIKRLLTNDKNQYPIHEHSQTDPIYPEDSSIVYNAQGPSIELRRFRSLLNFYKIPVHIEPGDALKLNFGRRDDGNAPKRKFKHWNDIAPIDVTIKRKEASKGSSPDIGNTRATVDADPEALNNVLNSIDATVSKGGSEYVSPPLMVTPSVVTDETIQQLLDDVTTSTNSQVAIVPHLGVNFEDDFEMYYNPNVPQTSSRRLPPSLVGSDRFQYSPSLPVIKNSANRPCTGRQTADRGEKIFNPNTPPVVGSHTASGDQNFTNYINFKVNVFNQNGSEPYPSPLTRSYPTLYNQLINHYPSYLPASENTMPPPANNVPPLYNANAYVAPNQKSFPNQNPHSEYYGNTRMHHQLPNYYPYAVAHKPNDLRHFRKPINVKYNATIEQPVRYTGRPVSYSFNSNIRVRPISDLK